VSFKQSFPNLSRSKRFQIASLVLASLLQGCTNSADGGGNGSPAQIRGNPPALAESDLNLRILGADGVARNFLTAEKLVLHPDDVFELTSTNVNLQQAQVTTEVSCDDEYEVFVLRRTAGSKIPLLDMLSLEAIRNLISKTEPVLCEVSLSVDTGLGAKKTFLMEQISLSPQITSSRGLGVAGTPLSSPASGWTEGDLGQLNLRSTMLNPQEQGTASLLCQHYTAHSDGVLLADFNVGSLMNENFSAEEGENLDPRIRNRIQNCIFLKRTLTGVTERSQVLTLRFDDVEPLVITTTVSPDSISSPTQRQTTLLQVEVQNPNSYAVGVAVPSHSVPVPLNFVSVVAPNSGNEGYAFPFLTPWTRRPLSWDANPAFTHDNLHVVWVRPYERVVLKLVIRSRQDCWPNQNSPGILVGFDFQLPDTSVFRLRRTRANVVGGPRTFSGAAEEIAFAYNFVPNLPDSLPGRPDSRRLGFHYSIRQNPYMHTSNVFFVGNQVGFFPQCPDEI
jgi:hypothetical protein